MRDTTTTPSADARLAAAERRLDRLEESIELIAQLLAHGPNIGRLRRSVGYLQRVGERLADLITQAKAEHTEEDK